MSGEVSQILEDFKLHFSIFIGPALVFASKILSQRLISKNIGRRNELREIRFRI